MSHRPYQAVVFQPETYQALQKGINLVVDAVRPTLGPVPRVVAVELTMRRHSAPELLDSGAVIAQRIVELPDRDQDVGAMLIRDTLMRVQKEVGDGTATTAVLVKALVDGGVRYLASGGNAMMLRRHLEAGRTLILSELSKRVSHPQGKARLTELAQAICYDPPLAELLGEIFDIIGEYGRLEIRASRGRTMEREYVEGMYWKNGVVSREMLTDKIKLRTEMGNVAVLVSDLKLTDVDSVVPLLAQAKAAEYGGLLIVAYEYSSSVLSLLLANSNDEFPIVAVQAPGTTPEERGAALLDMVKLTGGHAYLTSAGHETLAGLKGSDLGRARSAWATTLSFGIAGGKGNARALRAHIAELRSAYKAAETVEERQALQERIGKLMGGSARLHVGGITESAILARRELAERAAEAMRSAMVEGVLPGGGVALLACRPALRTCLEASQDADERAAYQILLEAMEAPLRCLAANAGHDPSMVMARIAAAASTAEAGAAEAGAAEAGAAGGLVGFDAVEGKVVDMAETGIVDPAAAIKTAVRAAVNTASLALTTDVLIHHLKPPITSPLYPSYARRQRAAGRTP
jgi:chaperonin GroEL